VTIGLNGSLNLDLYLATNAIGAGDGHSQAVAGYRSEIVRGKS
jgi:hypothetical protein